MSSPTHIDLLDGCSQARDSFRRVAEKLASETRLSALTNPDYASLYRCARSAVRDARKALASLEAVIGEPITAPNAAD